MTDNELGRAFTTMIILLIALTFILAFLGNIVAGDVTDKLNAERNVFLQNVVAERISPVGQMTIGEASELVATSTQPEALPGDEVYNSSCAACHGTGVAGAPKVGDTVVWADRISVGIDKLYDSAINGLMGESGVMPAKGGNSTLSDGSIQAAVDYMIQQSK